MKPSLITTISTLALAALLPLKAPAQSDLEKSPAYLPIDKVIDAKIIKPSVNVNLPRFLLMDVASGFDGSTNDPLAGTGINFKDLVQDVKLIRLMIIENPGDHKKDLEKGIAEIRSILRDKWSSIVSLPDEGIGVYAIGDASGESMAGVAVVIYDGDEAIIGNIVGKVSIGKLISVAGKFKGLPPELMQKLMGITANGAGESGDKKSEEAAPKAKPEKSETKTN